MRNEPRHAGREVLAIRYGHRVTTRAESFLNFHLYGEPDGDMDLDYFFWVIRDPGAGGVTLVDTGFAPEAGDRRRRLHYGTPARSLPALGIDPDDVGAVVVSHAHWDHIGNLREFPRANIVMAAAEYAFWTSPLARRWQFASQTEPGELTALAKAHADDRITLVSGQHTLAPGIELIEVGGHTPGQLIVSVATRAGSVTPAGTVVLASDALHFYEEVEQDRPFAVLTDLPGMYRAYDTLAQLARQPGTRLVAGHDPAVRARFAPYRAVAASPGALAAVDLTRPTT